MRFEGGYLTLGRVRGAPVRVHWSAPVAAVVLGQLRFVPGFWLAFIGLILVHELGHALMVSRSGARVLGIDVNALGGQCRYEGNVTPMNRALIAWGGVLAQLVVLLVAGALLLVFGSPHNAFLADIAEACTFYNLTLMGLNLLPFRQLDGHEAWKIIPLLRSGRRRPPPRPPATPLARTHDVELEVRRLRELLEAAPRRR